MLDKADAKDIGKKRSKNGEKEKEKFKWSLHGSRPSSDVQYSQQSLSDCSSAIQPPHMVVYATFTPLYLFEKKIFSLEEMLLRQTPYCIWDLLNPNPLGGFQTFSTVFPDLHRL
ncbi:androglobin [Phyllostomus discolor]|uniref:Androglobin n=1 Tax=Phyllostomus discolor TaxID=89673 RepID=A0A834AKN4_9CHIR|nr:androglobin [Phyllostomus discolor]